MGFWQTVITGTIAGVLGGVVVAFLVPSLRSRISRIADWFTRQGEAAKKAKAIIAKGDVDALRKRVVEVAKAKGIRVAASATGSNPAIYTWANGNKSAHYSNFVLYKQHMSSGRADPLRTHSKMPVDVPVTRWSEGELLAWLNDHDR